jgi:hypothetical protein
VWSPTGAREESREKDTGAEESVGSGRGNRPCSMTLVFSKDGILDDIFGHRLKDTSLYERRNREDKQHCPDQAHHDRKDGMNDTEPRNVEYFLEFPECNNPTN